LTAFRTKRLISCDFPYTVRLVKKGPNLLGKTSILALPLLLAYSDESGHLFRFVSDTDPTISDSCRSEATLVREQ
jgi:hypothetical protein